MRFGWCETVFIGGLILCWGSLPGPALAENSTGTATRVVANYRVDLDNFNLGSFRFITSLNGSDYRVRGNGHFSILGGLLYDLRATTTSSGKVTSAGPEPATYVLSYAGGGGAGQLRMSFDAGAVTELSIVPKQTRDPREIPITKEQLVGVLDPIAAAFFHARSDDPNGDLKICDRTVPVFDGLGDLTLCSRPSAKSRFGRQPQRRIRATPSFVASSSSQYRGTHLTIPISSSCPTQTQLKSGSCRRAGPICMCPTTFCCRRMPAYCQQPQSHYAPKETDKQTRGRERLHPSSVATTMAISTGLGLF